MNYKIYFVKWTRGKGCRKSKIPQWSVRKDSDRAYAELLGIIRYDYAWRQFVFVPEPCYWKDGCKWSSGCLTQIAGFLVEQNNLKRWK